MKKRKVDYELIQDEDPSLILPRPRLIMIPNRSINPPHNPSLDSTTGAVEQLDHCPKHQRALEKVEESAQRDSLITEQEAPEAEGLKQVQESEEDCCSTPKTPTAHEELSVIRVDDRMLAAAATDNSGITATYFRVSAAPALICPPAPRKPKAKPKLIRKQSQVGFFIPPDLDLFFSPPPPSAGSGAAPAIAKTSAQSPSSPSSSSSSSSSSSLSAVINPQSSTCPE